MVKKIFVTALGLIVLIGAIVGIKVLQITTLIAQVSHMTLPPDAVTTAEVKQVEWRPTFDAIGSLSAVQGVTLSAEVEAKIVEIDFQPGAAVKAGDLLIRQDTSVEQAELRSAEATVDLARINLKRSRELLAKATISQSQLDADVATYAQSVAAVDNIRALIAKKTIRAPFAGRLGVRLVDLGQMLRVGDAIVSLQALDPIFADFYLPQQDLSRLHPELPIVLTSDGFPGHAVQGKITAINPDVDASTRNVLVQATVRNPDERLHPGMFVNVSVELPETHKLLTIPTTSILYAPYGDTVFIVEQKKNEKTGQMQSVVRQQIVRLGETRGDFVAVTAGVKAGETVVTSGVFRLRPGGVVFVNNAVAPDAQLAPNPSDS